MYGGYGRYGGYDPYSRPEDSWDPDFSADELRQMRKDSTDVRYERPDGSYEMKSVSWCEAHGVMGYGRQRASSKKANKEKKAAKLKKPRPVDMKKPNWQKKLEKNERKEVAQKLRTLMSAAPLDVDVATLKRVVDDAQQISVYGFRADEATAAARQAAAAQAAQAAEAAATAAAP